VRIRRQRNSGYKAEQNKYRGTSPLLFPSAFPTLALIHTLLFGWALIRLQASGLAESIRRKKDWSRSICTSHTLSRKSGFALHYTFPTLQCFYASQSLLWEENIMIKHVVTSLAGW